MGNLKKRILSAAVIVPLLMVLLFFGSGWLFFSVVVAFATLCGHEFGTFSLAAPFRGHRIVLAGLAGICCASVGLFFTFPIALLICLPLVPILTFASFLLFSKDPSQSVLAFASTLSGAVYVGSLMGFLALIFTYFENGNHLIFTLLLATSLGDTFAFGFGKTMGRHKLSRIISPNKTWEGAIGSFLGALLSIFAASYVFLDLSTVEVILLALVLNIFCQVGDLSESFLKRGFGVKDSGKIIPGHGGLLDRIDALIFGAPIMFFFFLLR